MSHQCADQEDLLNRYMTLRYGLAAPAQHTSDKVTAILRSYERFLFFVVKYRTHTRRRQSNRNICKW